jgi:hypothetical protein
MKQIQPVQIWLNGQVVTADLLNVSLAYDNLLDFATFQYKLFQSVVDQEPKFLITGNLSIQGEDYIIWGSTADINEAAYIWVADQLNLTII